MLGYIVELAATSKTHVLLAMLMRSMSRVVAKICGFAGEIRRKNRMLDCIAIIQGLVNVPFWGYWTSPYSSHKKDHIPNGWVMFNGDI